MDIGQQFALLVGALCLGVALTLGVIFAIAERHSNDPAEGCFSKVLVFAALSLAGYFFYLGLAG